MKKLLALALLLLFFANARAQEDKLTRLMNEREQLVLEYQYYNQQNSNFWGKKSKKDLLNIIETLKGIIKKDSELIAAVREQSIKKIAETTVETQRVDQIKVQDQRQIDSHIGELKSQISTLQAQIKKHEKAMKGKDDQLAASQDLRYGKDKIIAILAGGLLLFVLYAVVLQVRLNKALAKPKRKSKAS
ncbi:hypothetical protein [Pontibacter sp. SGAir0037]|uniref:hypothetical protein n=1 Tax=Pontibacter sp. SGAir0037 TaxID=2571030 RepID=UPI001F113658|nr:hypothetical protein [Pontibacter sp. SGAir0037]